MDFWGYWDQNNQGFLLLGTNSANAGSVNFFNPSEFVGTPNSNGSNLKPGSVPSPTGTIPVSALSASSLKLTSGVRNLYGVGLRPVFWVLDNFAIQGQAGYNYVDNVRGYSGTNAFGRGGSIGVFTIAPTIKPKGGYFTRPEIRVFATYSIWSNSLRGSTTPIGEGGNMGNTTNFSGDKSGCLLSRIDKSAHICHTGRSAAAEEKQPTGPGPKGCDEKGPAAAWRVGHVSIQICSLLPPVRLGPPCRLPILIATNHLLFRGQETSSELEEYPQSVSG
jgi:LamB porin